METDNNNNNNNNNINNNNINNVPTPMDQKKILECLAKLKEDGYCVVPSVLNDEECAAGIDGMWTWLESLGTGINRKEENSWNEKRWVPNTKGIVLQLPVGQEQFAWDIRQNPKIANVFATLWETKPEDMLTSFDRICIMVPPELNGSHSPIPAWPHTDQNPVKKGLRCVQGFVTLEEVGPNDGTLMVYKGSHKLHENYFKTHACRSKTDFVLLPKGETWYQQKGCEIVRVTAPKGSVILWDSRTIHYNCAPKLPREIPRFRYVVYVCMTPRAWTTEDICIEKTKVFEAKRCTNHWPHEVSTFGYREDIVAQYNVSLSLAKLTPLGRRLAGYLT